MPADLTQSPGCDRVTARQACFRQGLWACLVCCFRMCPPLFVCRLRSSAFLTVAVDIQMPPEAPTDFPLSIHISQKYGVVYLITKGGHLLLLDALTGTEIFR